jgi:hypothetical protein
MTSSLAFVRQLLHPLLLSVAFRPQKNEKMSDGRVAIQKWVKKWYHRLVSSEATYHSPGKLANELERAAACMVASFPQAKLKQEDMSKVMTDYHTAFRHATGVPVKNRAKKLKPGQAPPVPKDPVPKMFPLSTLHFTYI